MSPTPMVKAEEVHKSFGRLEVLHNNAGGSTAQDDTAVNAIAYGPLVSTSLFSVEGHLVRATFNG